MDALADILQLNVLVLSGNAITLGQVLYVLALFLLGIGLLRWSLSLLRRYLMRRDTSPDLIQIICRAWLVLGIAILVLSALDLLNVPLAAFAFISGAVAIGFGFGAQNIINNFISGWILMWERPIRIGDFLEMGDMRGTVETINTRSTRIRRADGVHMLVPNSHLLENTVINWTLVDQLVRTNVTVGVAYGSPVQKVRELLTQVAKDNPLVLKDPPFGVFFDDFGDNALSFDLVVWVEAGAERSLRQIRSELRFSIDAVFAEHGIVIAFPQRDVHVDGELLLRRATEETSEESRNT